MVAAYPVACFTGVSMSPLSRPCSLGSNMFPSRASLLRTFCGENRVCTAKRPRTWIVAASSPSPETPPEGSAEESMVQYYSAASSTSTPDAAPSTAPSFQSLVEVPLFPLPLVLNPGSNIPLHIFEMRYRLMFNRIRDGNSPFGIVFYNRQNDAIASVGCSAELLRFEPLSDGRIMTNNIGKSRFRILSVLEDKPFKRALVEYFRDEPPSDADLAKLINVEMQVWNSLQDVLRLSNKLYEKTLDLSNAIKDLAPKGVPATPKDGTDAVPSLSSGGPLSPSELQRIEDFSFAVSQILDMPVLQQQLLLQTRSTLHRLEKQCKMLETARQYLAAQVVIKDVDLKF